MWAPTRTSPFAARPRGSRSVVPRGEPSSTTVAPSRATATAEPSALGSPVASITTRGVDRRHTLGGGDEGVGAGAQRSCLAAPARSDHCHLAGLATTGKPLRQGPDRARADDCERITGLEARPLDAVAGDDREVDERGVGDRHPLGHRRHPGSGDRRRPRRAAGGRRRPPGPARARSRSTRREGRAPRRSSPACRGSRAERSAGEAIARAPCPG